MIAVPVLERSRTFALELFQHFAHEKMGNGDVTFRELKDTPHPNLRLFATNLSRRITKEFSYEKSPDISVALAARMSMSIPFFFKAVKQENNEIFVDGGVMFNYPILTFDDKLQDSTLGLAFSRSNDSPGRSPKIDAFGYCHPITYIRNLFESMTNAQVSVWLEDQVIRKQTILIDTGDISYIDFKLTSEQKITLLNNGEKAARKFLAKGS